MPCFIIFIILKEFIYVQCDNSGNNIGVIIMLKTHFCEVMIEYKTTLSPAPLKAAEVIGYSIAEAVIENVCNGKVIIGGILHKTIEYCSCKINDKKQLIKKEIPFSCFIDVDQIKHCGKYKVKKCDTICSYCKIFCEVQNGRKHTILHCKDIIKVEVENLSDVCEEECFIQKGETFAIGEICFMPAVNPENAAVNIFSDTDDFKIELLSNSFAFISGFFTITVHFRDRTTPAVKDVAIQAIIPIKVECEDMLDKDKWKVIEAKLCNGTYSFECPDKESKGFHKLVTKEVLEFELKYNKAQGL